jgi:osmotically-inducible protein OsmY
VDYFFTDRESFSRMADRGDFLEWAEFNGQPRAQRCAVVDRAGTKLAPTRLLFELTRSALRMRVCIQAFNRARGVLTMTFGNFWRGGGRERYGSERDQGRNRDRWPEDPQRQGSWERDRDEYGGGRESGSGREGRYGSSDWESGDYYAERSRGYGGGGYGGSEDYGGGRQGYGGDRYRGQGQGSSSQSGRSWGSEQRESDYTGSRYGGSEYDYRGGSLYGGGFGRGSSDPYGTAGSYSEDYPRGSRYAGQGMYRGRGPRNYKRSDERIREDVCECLTQDDRIDASSIEVTVTDGEVTLAGSVFERGDKRRAEDLAECVSGVKDVRNNLRLSSEQSGQTTSSQGQQQGAGQQGQTGQAPRH